MEPLILDHLGNPITTLDPFKQPCPKCWAGPDKRVPSGGFGQPHYVCICGYEFEELKCPSVS